MSKGYQARKKYGVRVPKAGRKEITRRTRRVTKAQLHQGATLPRLVKAVDGPGKLYY